MNLILKINLIHILFLIITLIGCKTSDRSSNNQILSALEASANELCEWNFSGNAMQRCLDHVEDGTDPVILDACILSFSKDLGRLRCADFIVDQGLQAGNVEICDEAFTKESLKFKCLELTIDNSITQEQVESCHLKL